MSIKELLQPIIGKRFKDQDGKISKRIKSIEMIHVVEEDSRANDYWGEDYYILHVFFSRGKSEPLAYYISDEIID